MTETLTLTLSPTLHEALRRRAIELGIEPARLSEEILEAVLQGHALWGMVLMAAFGIGFSLPLSAILFGVSFGKASLKAQKAEAAIRVVAGVLLVGAGFYLLAQF